MPDDNEKSDNNRLKYSRTLHRTNLDLKKDPSHWNSSYFAYSLKCYTQFILGREHRIHTHTRNRLEYNFILSLYDCYWSFNKQILLRFHILRVPLLVTSVN